MKTKWSIKQINDWYDNRPWIRGCNFMSSDCANRVDQWQAYEFDKRLATADRELELAASIGFNSIRIIMEFFVWQDEHDSYMSNLERYIQTAAKHGISVMITFGNDCLLPKHEFVRPKTGPQIVEWGYHGGRKLSPLRDTGAMGWSPLDEPDLKQEFLRMVSEIVGKYANDERVIVWDLMNEAGNNGRGKVSVPHIKELFAVAREQDPCQPLTVECWLDIDNLLPTEKVALEMSDIVSYHNYMTFERNVHIIDVLRELGRPIVNTEWLCRPNMNRIQELFPLFYLERIGCYNWGLVAGKYQTYEPIEGVWQGYEKGQYQDWDFRIWMHDLFRPSFRPYDPKEIDVIKRVCKMADEKWKRHSNGK